MIKIAQFGEGIFLRSFVDIYFNTLNREGGDYSVDIICPIPNPHLDAFYRADCKYNVVFRGERGEGFEKITAVNSITSPFEGTDKFFSIARDKELKLIVSNTTDAGIRYSAEDSFSDFPNVTYPAKLTRFLYERYLSGGKGVFILPVELIDNNANELLSCVRRYIKLWELPEEFYLWNENENKYLNTLVDRIVSGHPKDSALQEELFALVGERDELLSVCEPFGLWVIEAAHGIEQYIKPGRHNIDVILTDNIAYYKKRKVRVLNGSHTNLVAAGLLMGKKTVFDCMEDEALFGFVERTAREEIAPFVSAEQGETLSFFDDVISRFKNPYLNHALTAITLNSISKWRARNLPSFSDYYNEHGRIPQNMTVGFSALMALYSRAEMEEDGYYASTPTGKIKLLDDTEYLDYFANGGSITEFMKRKDVFGEDLTLYSGFAEAVEKTVNKINSGEAFL